MRTFIVLVSKDGVSEDSVSRSVAHTFMHSVFCHLHKEGFPMLVWMAAVYFANLDFENSLNYNLSFSG